MSVFIELGMYPNLLSFQQDKDGILLKFPKVPTETDYVVELLLK